MRIEGGVNYSQTLIRECSNISNKTKVEYCKQSISKEHRTQKTVILGKLTCGVCSVHFILNLRTNTLT